MRPTVSVVLALIAVCGISATGSSPIDYPGEAPEEIVHASTQSPPKPDVDVEVHKGESRRDAGWYEQPLTIGLGVLAFLGLIFLAARLNRRAGTPAVRP